MSKQNSCIITGSFDPFTTGHLDLVSNALEYFDKVHILIADNPNKKYMFTAHERRAIIEDALDRPMFKDNVVITEWHRAVVDFCEVSEVYTIVRGIRDANDMAYELNMAHTNRMLGRDKHGIIVDTIFIPSYYDNSNISSSLIRQFINLNDSAWSGYVSNPKFIQHILDCKHKFDTQKLAKETPTV